MRKVCLSAIICWLCSLSSPLALAQKQLAGDEKAVALVDQMLQRLGGKEIWARSRTLYVEYHGWRDHPTQAVIERAWRDLQQPNQRMEIEGSLTDLVLVFTPDSNWISRDGAVSDQDATVQAADLRFWPYDFYTMIHNLAVGDSRIRLEFEAPMRVTVSNRDGDDWGWWDIDSTGAPVRWGANYEDEVLEYVYGPLKTFGNVSFPAWGTAADGSWRFEYVAIDVDAAAIADHLLLRPSQ